MFLIWEEYGPAHLILRNAEVIWCPFQRRSSTVGHICPCVNSLPLLALCPCVLRHGRCVYSLEDQHVSLWPWPSHSSSASCLEQAVLRTTALQRPSGGGKTCGNILCVHGEHVARFVCGRWVPSPSASSSSLLKSLWLNSPHQVLCLIKRFSRISLFFSVLLELQD